MRVRVHFLRHSSFTMDSFALLMLLISSTSFMISSFHVSMKPRFGQASLSMLGDFVSKYEELSVVTDHGFSLKDITSEVEQCIATEGVQEGVVTVISKHSTVSVCINEFEPRFVDDVRQFFLKLAPPHYPYLHNDVAYRVGPDDWPGGDEAWREFRRTQPVNAHSHLVAMMLGTTESIPISKGVMQKGKYQNIMVADIDGNPPKCRTIGIQIMGTK